MDKEKMDKEKMDKEIKRLNEIIDEILHRVVDIEKMVSIHDLKNHLKKNNLMNQELEDSIEEFKRFYEEDLFKDIEYEIC